MTDEELIARLRKARKKQDEFEAVMLSDTAADRIEALVKERDKLLADFNESSTYLMEALIRAERLEAALREMLSEVEAGDVTLHVIRDARAALTQKEQRDWRSETIKTEDGYNG